MDLDHSEKAVIKELCQYCAHKFKSRKLIHLKVVVPSLQRLGSAVMNITGAISVTNHTHLEITKDNHSMPKLTYLGPW